MPALSPLLPLTPSRPGPSAETDRLHEACREFEGLFLAQMLRAMRGEGSPRGVLPVSSAEKIFWGQYCQAVGEEASRRAPLGLAEMLQRYLAAPLQE